MDHNKIRELLRRPIDLKNRNGLKNRDFTVLSHNCNGGVVLHDLGQQFRSPTVNLFMKADDYIKFLERLEHYLGCSEMSEVHEEGVEYPICLLDDIRLYCVHYKSFEEARDKWFQRCKRVNLQNLYVMFSQRDGCTKEHIRRFSELPYKHKVVFTAEPMPEFDCAFWDPCFPVADGEVGTLTDYPSRWSGRRYIDAFDYVSFFNER